MCMGKAAGAERPGCFVFALRSFPATFYHANIKRDKTKAATVRHGEGVGTWKRISWRKRNSVRRS